MLHFIHRLTTVDGNGSPLILHFLFCLYTQNHSTAIARFLESMGENICKRHAHCFQHSAGHIRPTF